MARAACVWIAIIVCPPLCSQEKNAPVPIALAKLPADLQKHLLACEAKSASVETMFVEFDRDIKNTLTHKTSNCMGTYRSMKPDRFHLRIENKTDHNDVVVMINDGQSFSSYSGLDKTVRTSTHKKQERIRIISPTLKILFQPYWHDFSATR